MILASSTLEKALSLAMDAHKGQKDLDGRPVILHPLTVGIMGRDDAETVCGFLHDVVEDSGYSFDDLLGMGYPEEVVETLRLLTHGKDEPYMDYVRRIAVSGNETALMVKFHDLVHNLSRGRAGGHEKQVAKHSVAIGVIAPVAASLDFAHTEALLSRYLPDLIQSLTATPTKESAQP